MSFSTFNCFKSIILIALIVAFTSTLQSQNISINSTGALPDASAMLDVVSANKGLLLPRVSLTSNSDVATVPNPAVSLVVYNTNAGMTNGGVGFWYWDGLQWVRFSGALGTIGNTGATGPTGADGANGLNGATGAIGLTGATGAVGATGNNGIDGTNGSIGATGTTGANGVDGLNGTTGATGTDGSKNAWGFAGSTGTIDGTSFIGTIDNIPLNLRVNNQQAGRIDQHRSNAYWGHLAGNITGTGTDNTAAGSRAFTANTTGSANVANGSYALNANTTGIRNTAVGYGTLVSNTEGEENTAIGMYTLASNISGTRNTAIGNEALSINATGINNTANGYYALRDNSEGSNNTAIGYGAGYTTTGNDNTFVGYFANLAGNSNLTNATAIGAYAQVTASNSLVLGNNANVGIGVSAPLHKLDVNGTFNVNGVTTCTSGSWASSDQLFKTNVTPISNALAIINQLQPHSFFFDTANPYGLNFSNQKQYGLIAQEVQAILPELISTTHKGAVYDTAGVVITPAVDYLTLNYTAFIAILMKGMQEQEQKISTLTTKTDNQDALINSLQQQINTLSNQIQQLQGQ